MIVRRRMAGFRCDADGAERGVRGPVLPDVLAPDLDVVFCGTAVGEASARAGAYYAGPGNRFWPALYEAGFTPVRLKPQEYRQLLDYRIGLTDLAKRIAGNDVILSRADFDCEGLRQRIERLRPRILAFTCKRAAQEFTGLRRLDYGPLEIAAFPETGIFVLPSPSGSACRYWHIEPWKELKRLVDRPDDARLVPPPGVEPGSHA